LVYSQTVLGLPSNGLAVMAGVTILSMVYGLLAVPDTKKGCETAVKLLAGLLYVALLISFVPLVRGFENGLLWLFFVLLTTWAGDTGGYLAGRAFGKHKLFPRISPKKTWEGAAGGLLLSVAVGVVGKLFVMPEIAWVHVVCLAILLDVAGVVGDLTESMLKRASGVKDSGAIMPGHGGALDRLDSLLFTVPALWIYLTSFGLAS